MATKKRQQKLSDEKQSGRKRQRNLEKENVEELHKKITTPINEDESLLKQVDKVFKVKHPPELLTFWRHAVKLDAKNPLDAFSELDSLSLVGPFLFLANGRKKTKDDNESLFLKSRFATDLPEMETVLVHRGGRFCYWRDVPDEMPNILGEKSRQQHQHFPTVTICGERDLFDALQYLLQKQQLTGTKTKKQSNATSSSGTKSEQLAHLFPNNYDMTKYGPDYLQMLKKRRAKWAIGMPFHDIGVKVPINDKGVGYRPVSDDKRENAQLKRNIETMGTTDSEEKKAELKEKFHQIYAWIQFANDEMDFGMGLEFGHDLFMSNYACFDGMAKTVLMTAYELLGRKQFATILEKHMEVRRRNINDGTK